jgi:hypothetical protein
MLTYQGEHGSKVARVDPLAWSSMEGKMDEFAINAVTDALSGLLSNIDDEHLADVWLDICGGNGIAAVNCLWPKGVDLLHIDKTPVENHGILRSRIGYYLATEEKDSGWLNGIRYSEENYLQGDVVDLSRDPNQILARVGRNSITGALLLNPLWDEEINRASIKIAADLLKVDSPLVVVTDQSDTGHLKLLRSLIAGNFGRMEEYPQAGPASYGFIAYR